MVAYKLKEEFRKFYETSSTVKSGLRRMKKWLAQAQILYGKVTETIRTYLQGICHYFISHTTSGMMEGINNKAKLIIRQGYGFSNFGSSQFSMPFINSEKLNPFLAKDYRA
jgi:transposase